MMPTTKFMISHKVLVPFLACLLLFCPQCAFAQTKQDIEVSANVVQTSDPNALFLEFTLTNTTQKALFLNLSDLPTEWNKFSVVVVVVFAAYPKTLTPLIPLLSPLMGEIKISANEKLTKRINLFDRFPDLSASLLKSDAMILWAYQPNVLEQKHSTWFSGVVLHPRRNTSE